MPLTIAARLDRARHSHATLVRFSERREAFLEALGWEAFDTGFVRETSMADEQLSLGLGQTSCRESVCQYELIQVGIVSGKSNNETNHMTRFLTASTQIDP